MRIDLHVHSKHSKRPAEWFLKKIGCPESFTEPFELYEIAKNRGMTHITITDHNSIDGALEIAHLPDTFVSEEVTSYFPEDGCKMHILALDITENQHREIQKLRPNVYDLCAYFKRENIFNILAHPLYSLNDRLTAGHFERMLLLFENFELNGARNSRENQVLKTILNTLSPEEIRQAADRHNLQPLMANAHRKRLFGGSDDHSSLNIARTYTEFSDIPGNNTSLSAMQAGRIFVHAHTPSPQTMAHNLYSISWQFFKNKFNLEPYVNKDPLIRFLDRSMIPSRAEHTGVFSRVFFFLRHQKLRRAKHPFSDSLAALLRHESQKLIDEHPEFLYTVLDDKQRDDNGEQQWFHFVNQLSSRVIVHFGNHLLDHLSGANVFNIFHTIGSAGGLYTLLAPYFIAFSQFTMGRDLGVRLLQQFVPDENPVGKKSGNETRMAHFTDTFYDVNGVALTLQQQVRLAAATNRHYTLITCDDQDHPPRPGVVNFVPIGTHRLPEYEQQPLFYPPLLEMLDYCHRQDINHILTATPGPIGLAALAIARILKIPISGTYHTAIPQYVQILTGSAFMEEMAWKFVLWYYDQLDLIYAPSQSTKDELVEKGISREKVRVYPRGIDIELYHPAKRNGFYTKWGWAASTIKLIYVGRVSKEKNLQLLVQAYRLLAQTHSHIQLIIVGSGPYLEEMKLETADLPCLYTGWLEGEALAEAYASADLFVFPSTTDTFGNVILEAQASGLPVIVTDQGGPVENILPNETGLVVRGESVQGFRDAMEALIMDPDRRKAMGRAAREYMSSRSFESAFTDTWKSFGEVKKNKMTAAI